MDQPEINLRQAHLLQRSALLRQRLLSDATPLRGPLAMADRAYFGLEWLYRHPFWLMGALTVWMALRPRRLFQLARPAWWVYRLASGWRRWSGALPKFLN